MQDRVKWEGIRDRSDSPIWQLHQNCSEEKDKISYDNNWLWNNWGLVYCHRQAGLLLTTSLAIFLRFFVDQALNKHCPMHLSTGGWVPQNHRKKPPVR